MKVDYHTKTTPIADGYQIFSPRVDVAGVAHRKTAAQKFVKGKEYRIWFAAEPFNKHDKHAVRVMGSSKGWFFTKTYHIGYVPKEYSKAISIYGVTKLYARLVKTYISDKGFVEVVFQIMGPKGGKKEFNDID